jgi:hypothetical protein
MVKVCAPRLTALIVKQVEASRTFAVNFIAHSVSAPRGLQKDSYCCCVFLQGVRKSVRLITALKWGCDKSLGALSLILFCTSVGAMMQGKGRKSREPGSPGRWVATCAGFYLSENNKC